MIMDANMMMRTVKERRIKCTILYATETGMSKNYANVVKDLFDRNFNCSLYCMEEYSRAKLEHEQLVLVVTSTFGSGDPPANGEVCVNGLLSQILCMPMCYMCVMCGFCVLVLYCFSRCHFQTFGQYLMDLRSGRVGIGYINFNYA